MAIIVNILNRGARVELINTDGKVVTFSDLPDGYHYEVMDICGTHIAGAIVGTKKARDAAIEFLQRRRYEHLARRIQADSSRKGLAFIGYEPPARRSPVQPPYCA